MFDFGMDSSFMNNDSSQEVIEEPIINDIPEELSDSSDIPNAEEVQIQETENFTLESYLTAPEEFNTHEEAVQWYAERFQIVKEDLLNPDSEVGSYYRTQYMENQLKTLDEEIHGFKDEYLAMKANPKEYLLQYVPAALAMYGIEPVMSQEEILNKVEIEMSQAFGPDYKSKWDVNELIYPQSYSNQLLQAQNQLINKYNELNENNKKVYAEWNQNLINGKSNLDKYANMENEQVIEAIKIENRDKFLKEYGFDEESYNTFIQEAAKKTIEIEDLHKVIYFDGYLKQAYEKGLNDAKQGLYGKLNQEGNARKITTPRIKSTESDMPEMNYNGYQDFFIPNY